MAQARAVITGFGIVSPYGHGAAAFSAGIRAGRSATRRISLFDPLDLPCQVAAEVPGFEPEAHLPPDELQRVGRIVPMALAAARECLENAGLADQHLTPEGRTRVGVVIGRRVVLTHEPDQPEISARGGEHRLEIDVPVGDVDREAAAWR